MNIVIFTAHYPFKPAEEYLVQELEIMSQHVNKITIICGEKDTKRDRRVTPENVEVIIVNRKYKLIKCILLAIIRMFSIHTFREIIYSKKVLNNVINIRMIKMLFLYNVVSQRYVYWVKNNIEKTNRDLTLYSYWLSQGAYALSRLKREGYKFKAISRAHGYDAFLDRGYQPYRRDIYQFLDEIHFVSEIGRKQFEEKVVLPQSTKRAILFTSRLGTVNQGQLLAKGIRKVRTTYHIVSCSAIIPLKRLDILLDALTYLNEYDVKWTHFGDGSLKQELLNRISEESKYANITVDFKGQVENLEILRFYDQNYVDVFINVSDYEGVPVSIMEALSYGIPIIARDVGGNSEIVMNKVNGILLEKEIDSISLQNAIRYFIDLSNEEIITYRDHALRSWDQKYNAVHNYTKFAHQIKGIDSCNILK